MITKEQLQEMSPKELRELEILIDEVMREKRLTSIVKNTDK